MHGELVAQDDITINSRVDTTQSVVAAPSGVKGFAGSAAVSVLVTESRAMVWDDANLTANDGDIVVDAQTVDRSSLSATSKAKSGKVGVAIAVAVENGLTEAQLAGTVSVGGAITVNAETSREGISGSYFKFIPKSSNGVTASAGTAAGGRPMSLMVWRRAAKILPSRR